MNEVRNLINELEPQFSKDLADLMKIQSISIESEIEEQPFGRGVREAFDRFLAIAQRLGFSVSDDHGYACDAAINAGDKYIGILGHLDVVPAGDLSLWKHPPYQLTEIDGMLYGRGVNDDKGPLLAALYAVFVFHEIYPELKLPVKVIAGGAEETTWRGIHHYFNTHVQPVFGFSPDGNFPVVNGEKGILKFCVSWKVNNEGQLDQIVQLTSMTPPNFVCDDVCLVIRNTKSGSDSEQTSLHFTGEKALSRHPERGDNAIWKLSDEIIRTHLRNHALTKMAEFIHRYFSDDWYGKRSNIYHNDKEMGETSITITRVQFKDDQLKLHFDYRYVNGVNIDQVKDNLCQLAAEFGGDFLIEEEKKMLYLPGDSSFIAALKDAYFRITGDQAEPITKGGASYARVLDNGVAFGATFVGEEPNPHMPNEHMAMESLKKACEIYVYALRNLAEILP